MEKYAPKFSKVLLTPDPHYIPGYTGYCPQLKYHAEKSYSKLTAELLTSPEVNHSSRLVLHTGHADSTETLTNIPDSNLKKMIPGYTGFIPKGKNYFACTYTEALSEVYLERSAKTQRRATDLPAVANFNQQFEAQRPKLPLTAISNEVFAYKPLKSLTPAGSPYSTADDDPQKFIISGFAGHVPKSRFLIGKGYPIITNQALIQFGKQQRREPTSLPQIYPPNRGVVPSFTGHIPGYRFMFGQSFGQLSRIALENVRHQEDPPGQVVKPSSTSIK